MLDLENVNDIEILEKEGKKVKSMMNNNNLTREEYNELEKYNNRIYERIGALYSMEDLKRLERGEVTEDELLAEFDARFENLMKMAKDAVKGSVIYVKDKGYVRLKENKIIFREGMDIALPGCVKGKIWYDIKGNCLCLMDFTILDDKYRYILSPFMYQLKDSIIGDNKVCIKMDEILENKVEYVKQLNN